MEKINNSTPYGEFMEEYDHSLKWFLINGIQIYQPYETLELWSMPSEPFTPPTYICIVGDNFYRRHKNQLLYMKIDFIVFDVDKLRIYLKEKSPW